MVHDWVCHIKLIQACSLLITIIIKPFRSSTRWILREHLLSNTSISKGCGWPPSLQWADVNLQVVPPQHLWLQGVLVHICVYHMMGSWHVGPQNPPKLFVLVDHWLRVCHHLHCPMFCRSGMNPGEGESPPKWVFTRGGFWLPRSGSKPTSTTLVSASFSRKTVGHAKKRRTSNGDKRKVSTHWLCGLEIWCHENMEPMGNQYEFIPSHLIPLIWNTSETKPWLWNESIHILGPYLWVSNIEWGKGLVTNHVVGIWDTMRNQCGNMGTSMIRL